MSRGIHLSFVKTISHSQQILLKVGKKERRNNRKRSVMEIRERYSDGDYIQTERIQEMKREGEKKNTGENSK